MASFVVGICIFKVNKRIYERLASISTSQNEILPERISLDNLGG